MDYLKLIYQRENLMGGYWKFEKLAKNTKNSGQVVFQKVIN